MEHTVINIFGAIVEYFAIYAFLWIFFDINPDRKPLQWACHICMAPAFFLFATYVGPGPRPLLFILCCMIVALCFRGNIWQRLFAVVVFQAILICLEFVLASIAALFVEVSEFNTYLALNIINKTLTIIAIGILFWFSKRYKSFFSFENRQYFMLLLFFSLTTFLMVITMEILLILLNMPMLHILECIIVLMALFANVALYYLFYQLSAGENAKSKLKLIELHLSTQKEQHQYLEHTYREVRKLSHDMKHYLAVVYSLLQQGETEKAMQELEKRQVEIAQNHVFDTGYPLLNSVLAYKLQWAKEQHIQTKIFWNLTEPLAINQTDLAVILANGLDNAIEAAGQVNGEQAYITVSAENKLHYLVLKISNNSAVPPLEKDGKLVTTKKENHLHGFGLESIHHLALQYEGESSFAYQDGEFVLTVMLKNKAETEQEGTDLAI